MMTRKINFWLMGICPLVMMYPQIAKGELINFNLLQMNDLYEINPVEGRTRGGIARVATIRQNLLKENDRTYTILAGDFLSPSALGTAKVDGKSLAGKQMVAVLNSLGLDYATFGNHEFDLGENAFLERLKEADFQWFSGNVSDRFKQPFPYTKKYIITSVKGQKKVIKVAFLGVTIDSNKANYVTYQDPLISLKEQVKELKGKVDVIVAVTHLSIHQDREIAEKIPEIDLILGGHEHENIQQWRGRDFTPIFKADANVKTVYIHRLQYDTLRKKLIIKSTLLPITDQIKEEPKTAKVVKQWEAIAYQAFIKNGFQPDSVITNINQSLDGLEASVRNNSTNLTKLIAKSMLTSFPEADVAIYNSGSIRLDDIIPPGKITQYDVIRILPFGNKLNLVSMTGNLLLKVLDIGEKNRGNGGYLQTANISKDSNGTWLMKGQAIDRDRLYQVAITDFLLTGKEQNLEFLNSQTSGLKILKEGEDMRFALIKQLKVEN